MPIRVNKVEISDAQIHEEMQYHPAANMEAARHQASQALVIEQLLLQEAREKHLVKESEGLEPSDAENAVDQLIKAEVSVPEADAETCARYYDQNRERFTDKKAGQVLPFEDVHDHIRDYLHARSLKTGISQYIQLLAGKARITGFDFDGADSPLVQ